MPVARSPPSPDDIHQSPLDPRLAAVFVRVLGLFPAYLTWADDAQSQSIDHCARCFGLAGMQIYLIDLFPCFPSNQMRTSLGLDKSNLFKAPSQFWGHEWMVASMRKRIATEIVQKDGPNIAALWTLPVAKALCGDEGSVAFTHAQHGGVPQFVSVKDGGEKHLVHALVLRHGNIDHGLQGIANLDRVTRIRRSNLAASISLTLLHVLHDAKMDELYSRLFGMHTRGGYESILLVETMQEQIITKLGLSANSFAKKGSYGRLVNVGVPVDEE